MSAHWTTRAEYENDTPPMPLWFALAIWIVALGVMFGASQALNAVQQSGEAPTYTCAPGTQYTTKECE